MKSKQSAVLACVGAVIGAGFASGREVVVFFTQYGVLAHWLILLSTLVMTGLCFLCMRAVDRCGCSVQWCGLVKGNTLRYVCSLALMIMLSGAMISAAGQVVALLWNHSHAYLIGVWGTIAVAMTMGRDSLKPLSVASAVLSMVLLCALMSALAIPVERSIRLDTAPNGFGAALKAIGYASMNMMLAIGIVCRSAEQTRHKGATAGLFGWIIGMLLMLSQCVYARHPEVQTAVFPIIRLLSGYGRIGYLTGAAVLYLAIMTTLVSVLYALRSAVKQSVQRRDVVWLIVPGLPLAVSGFGFAEIVDRLYAPAGWVCLLFVFLPIAVQQWKTAKKPTSS